jgi:UDP-glucose 4-epimerase
MRKFFVTVDEAVALIVTALANIDAVGGKVLARHMKAAMVGDLLELWIAERGGTWERLRGRPGERDDEFLIGDLELPYTAIEEFDGVPHYLISFNDRVPSPLPEPLSTANTDRLDRDEMLALLAAGDEPA